MKLIPFEDACQVCHGTTWTDDQIQLAMNLVKEILPETSAHFCEMHDVGIHIHDKELGRTVYISQEFIDRKGRRLYKSAMGNKHEGKFFVDQGESDVIRYTGKVFDGYSLEVCNYGLCLCKTLEEIVKCVEVVFSTMKALEHEKKVASWYASEETNGAL